MENWKTKKLEKHRERKPMNKGRKKTKEINNYEKDYRMTEKEKNAIPNQDKNLKNEQY